MAEIRGSIEVNGTTYEVSAPGRTSLADLLRERLGQTGTHVGCEQGVCGTCTVLIDGVSARSCLVLAAQAAGASVETVEGVTAEGIGKELAEALSEHGGLQCGFCTPGVIVTATELLMSGEPVTEQTVRAALSGNLCRCTGYEGIVDAVLAVGQGTARARPRER